MSNGTTIPQGASTRHSAATEKTLSTRRRHKRREESIYQTLLQLPAPGGPDILDSVHDVSCWDATSRGVGSAGCSSVVDWVNMPASCDPVQLLDNKQNTVRKHGDMQSQIATMVLERQHARAAAEPTGGTVAVAVAAGSLGSIASEQGAPIAAVTAAPASGKVSRGWQKRWQVESFALVLQHLLHDSTCRLHVVDFGCGSGSLLLPLAHRFPHCHFTGVEMKAAACAILRHRISLAGLTNVSVFCDMIERFAQPYDVALALHACGNATDVVLISAAQQRAAYVVSPCCVGKLKFSLAGGNSFGAEGRQQYRYTSMLPGGQHIDPSTGAVLPSPPQQPQAISCAEEVRSGTAADAGQKHGPEPTQMKQAQGDDSSAPWLSVTHPRSRWLTQHLLQPERDFKLMAKAADTNHSGASFSSIRPSPSSSIKPSPPLLSSTACADLPNTASSTSAPSAPATEASPSSSCLMLDPAEPVQHAGQQDTCKQAGSHVDASTQEVAKAFADVTLREHADSQLPASSGGPGTSTQAAPSASTWSHANTPVDVCTLCKLHVELDRTQAAREAGFMAGMFRLLHAHATAKGEILVGVPQEREEWAAVHAWLE